MKTSKLFSLTAILLAVAGFYQVAAAAPPSMNASLGIAMAEVFNSLDLLESQSQFGCESNGTPCLFGAVLRPGQTITLKRVFDCSQSWALVAAGDEDVEAIDISVTDPFGRLLLKNDTLGARQTAVFQPGTLGLHTITLTLSDAEVPCTVFLATLIDEGIRLSPDARHQAALQLFQHYDNLNSLSIEVNLLPSHCATWSVYGSVLNDEQRATIHHLNSGSGERLIICGQNETHVDLDLQLFSATRQLLAEDIEPDSTPVIQATLSDEITSLIIKNAGSGNPPTFVLTAVLTAE